MLLNLVHIVLGQSVMGIQPVFLQKILGKLLTINCISIFLHRFIDLQADNPATIERGHENWPSVKEDLGWGLSGNFEQSAKILTEIEAVEKARNWLEGILFKRKE